MNRSELVLAALAASDGAVHSPVQVQKLFFLIDRTVASALYGGPYFKFLPDDYGPFDKQVYEELEGLGRQGLVEVSWDRMKKFRLAPAAYGVGHEKLAKCPPNVAQYLRDLSAWVRSLSFAELVSAIYRQYPEMRANSVFRG
jgi:hypothetical protein